MNNQNNSIGRELETAGIQALSAASKTPFKTAFSITLGIGLGRLALFTLFMASFILLCGLAKLVFG